MPTFRQGTSCGTLTLEQGTVVDTSSPLVLVAAAGALFAGYTHFKG